MPLPIELSSLSPLLHHPGPAARPQHHPPGQDQTHSHRQPKAERLKLSRWDGGDLATAPALEERSCDTKVSPNGPDL